MLDAGPPNLSIHDLTPLDEGGTIARVGFQFQDHVAATWCIRMLSDATLAEVWCETEDDVTLIWIGVDERVEFVQVKADELQQLYSAAVLCADTDGASIAERSIKRDRCKERTFFRIATRRPVNAALEPLRLDPSSPERCISKPPIRALHEDISKRLPDVMSPKGMTPSLWLANLQWDVAESEDAIVAKNLIGLRKFLEGEHIEVFTEQVQELYDWLLAYVRDAAGRKWKHGAEKKKIRCQNLRQKLLEAARRIVGGVEAKGGENLRRKLAAAGIDDIPIANADDLRRSVRLQRLEPSYSSEGDAQRVELAVAARLQTLLAELDAQVIADNGPQFHSRCLKVIDALQDHFPDVELSTLQGVMYNVTDRCRHRFVRAGL